MSRSIRHPVPAVWLAGVFFGIPVLAQDSSQATGPSAEQARSLQQAGQWADASDAWRLVVEHDTDNGAAWFNLGYCLHAAGRLEHAVEAHRKASTFDDYHGIALYNLACACALTGRTDEALDALQASREAGFDLSSVIRTDSDLDSLRGDPRFKGFLNDRDGSDF